jgi:hypothetical protein
LFLATAYFAEMKAGLFSALGAFIFVLNDTALAEIDCSAISVVVANTQEIIEAPPQAIISLSNAEGCEASISYKKMNSGSKVGTLVTPWYTSAEISVLRLSPGLVYEFVVRSREVGGDGGGAVILNTTLSIPGSVWPFLTDRAQGVSAFVVALDGSPTWDMVALDVSATGSDPMFDGYVIIDSDGDIVWLWNITTLHHELDKGSFPSHCIDQRIDFSLVLQTMVRALSFVFCRFHRLSHMQHNFLPGD